MFKFCMKKIFKVIITLILIQILRIGFKELMFLFIERTVFNNKIINSIYMMLLIILMILVIKKKNLELNIFPKKFNYWYIILSSIILLLFITTPIINKDYSLKNIISLIYNAIITVVFEELLFRGFIWKYLDDKKLRAYIFSSILFGIWHFGYIDTVIFRTSIFNPNANIMIIMINKVITGIVLGCIFGILKYKTKNTYSSMMLHTFINTIGS